MSAMLRVLTKKIRRCVLAAICLCALAPPAVSQDINVLLPTDSIESLLRERDFRVLDWAGTRFEGDRTQRVVLEFGDSSRLAVKWARFPSGGRGEFNNRPRYEIAAYELQKLFLEEDEYVVPPTLARSVPIGTQRQIAPWAEATYSGTESVLVVLQYWLWNVSAEKVWDKNRFERDTAYARHFANLNLFTYLIRHGDANQGNVLISSVTTHPRLFCVDNGVAFNRREKSDRGTRWRRLFVKRLPRSTVERLRRLDREDLDRRLSVVAQFRLKGGRLVPTEPTEPIHRGRGVRRDRDLVQFGLTEGEIDQIWDRIRHVLQKVDEGKITLFDSPSPEQLAGRSVER